MRLFKSLEQTSTKRISFILATKNRPGQLDQALLDIKKIVTKKDELIIINGSSSFGSIRKVLAKHKNIIDVVISEKDISPAHAYNKGVLLSGGKYLINLTDDDSVYKSGVEKVVRVLDKNPDVDLLICGGIKRFGKKFSIEYLPPGINYGKNPEDVFNFGAPGVSFVLRKASLAKTGLHPLGLAADVEFVARCIKLGVNVKFCRVKLYQHNLYPHSFIISHIKEHQSHTYKLAWQYCSIRYSIRYSISKFLGYHPISLWLIYQYFPFLKPVFFPLKAIYYKFFKTVNPIPPRKKEKYLWDGGFS